MTANGGKRTFVCPIAIVRFEPKRAPPMDWSLRGAEILDGAGND